MKFHRKILLVGLVAPALVALTANAAEPGFYIGGGAGQTTLKTDLLGAGDRDLVYPTPLNGEETQFNGFEVDEEDTSYKAFLGYQFVPWLAIEAGYVELGSAENDRTFPSGTNIDGELDVGGWEGYLVPSLPLGEHFEVFAKVGGFSGDISADGKIKYPDGSTEKFDDSSDSESMLAYGGGVAWNFGGGHWSLRAEYTEYDADNVDDLYTVSGSLIYRFFKDKVEPAPEPAPAPVAAAPAPAPSACADTDGDGVCDSSDQCPNTPAGKRVGPMGCDCDYSLVTTFAFDSAELTAQDMAQLDELAAVLTNPALNFVAGTVDGHTDSVGDEAYNEGLSKRRADAVASYLQSKGVDLGDRFSTRGFGEAKPVADNTTAEGRALNRRVVISRTDCPPAN